MKSNILGIKLDLKQNKSVLLIYLDAMVNHSLIRSSAIATPCLSLRC